MDPHRFDRLSKSFATRLSRRGLLAGVSAGGAIAAIADAATAAAGAKTCVYAFDATIDVGPSSTIAQTNAAAGQLTFTVSANGAIDAGKLILKDGTVWAAVGQATGRAINLRFSVPNTGAFIAVGVGRHAISSCPSAMAGPASGPLRKDAGSWSATLNAAPAPTPTAAAVATAAVAPAGQPAVPTQPDDGGSAANPTEAPTTTNSACTLPCDASTLGLDPNACACLCAAGLTPCVVTLLGAGPQGYCAELNISLENCGQCGAECTLTVSSAPTAHPACEVGVCTVACDAGYVTCGAGLACGTNLATDHTNCGACGNACPGVQYCAGGVCTCGVTCGTGATQDLQTCGCDCVDASQTLCNDNACHDLATDAGNCGACGTVCPTLTPNCVSGHCI